MSRKFPFLTGANVAGGEWAWNASVAPTEGSHYQFVSNQDIDYLASKSINFLRILFSWELLQPTLNGPFSTGYGGRLKSVVDYATSKGLYVMVEPHGASFANFVKHKGNLVGSTAVPNSAFADLWKRMGDLHKGNPRVVFGLSNEPTNIGTMQWYNAAQAAITGIRSAGAKNMIMVAGNGFSQPSTWNQNWYDTASTKVSNATGWSTLSDPEGNTVVSVHTYFDQDSAGATDGIVSATIINEHLKPVVDWARAKGLKVHLSEFGANASAPGAKVAVETTCKFIKDNSDVLIGWAWWAYGPPSWWGNYRFTLCPKNNYTQDDVKMSWLQPFMAPLQNPADFEPAPTPPPAVPNIVLTSTTAKAPGDQGYNATKVVPAGQAVPEGTYTLKTATRTSFSDQTSFSVNVFLQNDHTNVDISWEEMKIDMRGHTINAIWNAEASVPDAAGIVTVKPVAGTKLVTAQGRNSFGFYVKRKNDPATSHYQVLVKSIKW